MSLDPETSDMPAPPGSTPGPPRERVLWNTVAIIIARVLSDVFQVLAALRMARHLGDRDFGLFGYFHSSMEVFRILTNFGLDTVSVRMLAVGTHHPRRVQKHLLVLKALLGAAGLALVAVTALFVPRFSEHPVILTLFALGLLPIAFNASLNVRFQAEHAMDRLIPTQFVGGALYLGAVILAVAQGAPLTGLVTVFVGYSFLIFALTLGVSAFTWPGSRPEERTQGFDRRLAMTLFREGIPVGLLGLIVVLYSRLGIFLLERFGSIEVVGQYFIAVKVSEPLLTIAGALSTSLFPVLSRLAERGEGQELFRRLGGYSLKSAALSGLVATAVTLASGSILGLIKPEFLPARGALIALSWATVFMFQNQLLTSAINSFGRYQWVTYIAGWNLCVFIASSALLIPRLGSTGAGLSTLVTEGINTLVQTGVVVVLYRRSQRRST